MEISEIIRSVMAKRKMNQTDFAREIGVSQATVSRWLSGKQDPTAPQFAKLIRFDAQFSQYIDAPTVDALRVEVIAVVEAGNFRPAFEVEPEDREVIAVHKNLKYGNGKRVAFKNRGDSMNLYYPDGCYLIAVPIHEYPYDIENGDHVIVQRIKSGEYEGTVKEYYSDGNRTLLLPKSTNPEHKPISIDDPRYEVVIVAVVDGHYLPR